MVDVQDLVDEASSLLEAPVTLEDRGFRLLAFGAHTGATDPVRVETVMGRGSPVETRAWFERFGIGRARGPVHVPGDAERGIAARLCLPARWRDVVQGYLWAIEPPDGLAPERVRAAEALAAQAGEALARLASRRRESERLVLDLLETGEGRSGIALEVADALALDPATLVAVVLLGTRPGVRLRAQQVHGPGGLPRGVGVAEQGGDVVLLVPARMGPDTVAAGAIGALDRLGVTGVVAAVGEEVALPEAAESHRQARAALRVARPQGPAGRDGHADLGPAEARVHDWADLGIRRILGGRGRDEVLAATRTPAVAALLAGPEELVETAWVHLEEAGSVGATARRLGLHRQSVYARLHRIEGVTGLDLARGRDRLELHLGLLVHREPGWGGPQGGGREPRFATRSMPW
ncbi:PucR family transcriptional regulator [Janibacter corallicola]|uniref:PucR family transcriptional regulator n=1 Tax=Janibacter corallicola TaxID=415212 RepID=UPI0012EE2FF3|nr:helix-turn-helix domain-containing protein [Janibacter corallicola]